MTIEEAKNLLKWCFKFKREAQIIFDKIFQIKKKTIFNNV